MLNYQGGDLSIEEEDLDRGKGKVLEFETKSVTQGLGGWVGVLVQ